MSSPVETVDLIQRLQSEGLTEELFEELHHFGSQSSIREHINYLGTIDRYRGGRKSEWNNLKLHCRLDLIEHRINVSGRQIDQSDIDDALAAFPLS
ncbi:hypothetical protein [Aestuariispira ectoiniformans]|uniref:hypothetical protein n=1 Tax=Aestuariispira ectoiniformans TaxID=2775080 RepID=UPI00223C2342|nr:hypothetical protein [Aestuariispira ectoiniformans]